MDARLICCYNNAVDVICEKCGKTITRRMKANISGDIVVCTPCLNLLHGAERRLQAAYKMAGKPGGSWSVQDGAKQRGPYTTEQMVELLRSKRLSWECEIWREGLEMWKPVTTLFTIPELCEGRLELRDFGQGDGTCYPTYAKPRDT